VVSVVILDENATYEEVAEPHTIETGDQIKVKQVLDEAVCETLKACGYEQDLSWENKKILMMVACCVFALLAQFYPKPFPESRLILGTCVGLYFFTSCFLQYIVSFVDKDSIAYTLPNKVLLPINILCMSVRLIARFQ
jgi:signal peptidase complex subunit 2